jgi:hypothetical protein
MSSTNLLSPLNFAFQLSRTPELVYSAQRASLPPITLTTSDIVTPFISIPLPGKIEYGEFSVTFLVDELLTNYLEIVNWMNAIGHPETLENYENISSDASVLIMNSAKRPVIKVNFTDVVPTSISQIDLDTTLSDVPYVPATVSFKYLRYNFEIL